MELLVTVGLMLAVFELKDLFAKKRQKQLILELKRVRRAQDLSFQMVTKMSQLLPKMITESESIKLGVESQQELLIEADKNLKIILNEYELNGIPMGFDRGKKFDFIEGI